MQAHALEKGEKLTKYLDLIQQVIFRIEHHEKTGYTVECVVDVEKHDDFIATSSATDVFAAIDDAVHKASRQLTDFKEKLKQERHH